MPLQLKDEGEVPRERWQYLVPETNYVVTAPNWYALYPEILRHCASNQIGPPSLQAVVDYCCANLSISCFEGETRQPLINRWSRGLPSLLPTACCGSK